MDKGFLGGGAVGGRGWRELMTTSPAPYEPPLLAAAREVGRVLDETAGSDPMFLSPGEKHALLVELTRSLGRLAGLRARTLATSDDLAAETGFA